MANNPDNGAFKDSMVTLLFVHLLIMMQCLQCYQEDFVIMLFCVRFAPRVFLGRC